jgi:hypothetical protein
MLITKSTALARLAHKEHYMNDITNPIISLMFLLMTIEVNNTGEQISLDSELALVYIILGIMMSTIAKIIGKHEEHLL